MILSESTTKWLSTKIIDDMDIDDEDREEQFESHPHVHRDDLTWEHVMLQLHTYEYYDYEHDFEKFCEMYVNGEFE